MTKTIKEIIQSVAGQRGEEKKKVEDTVQIVVFDLDKEEYGVPINDLREIIKMADITSVPDAPEFIRGILNLRGKIVVIVDLEKKFDLKRENKVLSKHIIITEIEDASYGVIVDEVAEVLRVPVSAIRSTPSLVGSKIHADYLSGVIVLDEKEPTKKLTEEECKLLLETRKSAKSSEKSRSTSSGQAGARLIILLDLPKLLQEKELLKVGEAVREVAD